MYSIHTDRMRPTAMSQPAITDPHQPYHQQHPLIRASPGDGPRKVPCAPLWRQQKEQAVAMHLVSVLGRAPWTSGVPPGISHHFVSTTPLKSLERKSEQASWIGWWLVGMPNQSHVAVTIQVHLECSLHSVDALL